MGLMYLLNPFNGNLVNATTGKDVEKITWEDLIKDVKQIVIAINHRIVRPDRAENAIMPFQQWLSKKHPEIELRLHSGEVHNETNYPIATSIILEASDFGMYVAYASSESGKQGKMTPYTDAIILGSDKEIKLEPFRHPHPTRGTVDMFGAATSADKSRISPAMMEAAKNVNVEDVYPKVTNAQLPKAPVAKTVNAYDIDWGWAMSGVLIIVDVQSDMGEADTQLNREMLGRCTDAIFTNNLEQYVMVKGDTDCDYDVRLANAIDNVSCVVTISGGIAEIEKFNGHEDLVGTEVL